LGTSYIKGFVQVYTIFIIKYLILPHVIHRSNGQNIQSSI